MRAMARPRARARGSRAFLVEALVLMAVLTACLAVLVHGFSVAAAVEREASLATRAAVAATTAAERFSADPAAVPESFEEDGLAVRVAKTPERTAAGTLWRAVVEVSSADGGSDGPIASLETAAYEPEGGE